MTILRDNTILTEMKARNIVIKPLPTIEQIQPSSIDLRLGNEYLSPIHQQETIDIRNNEPQYQALKGDAILLPAGEFILGTTKEWVEIPSNMVARVEGRSSIGRLGILIHVSAGFIDSGFKGNITLEIKNLSNNNIILYEGMRICQIVFETLDGTPNRIYGEADNKYQNQQGVTPSLIYWDSDNDKLGANHQDLKVLTKNDR